MDINMTERTSLLQEVGQAYGLSIDPHDLVETLEVGGQQRVEIIKVLYRGAEILILDEPTAVLVPQEVEELFKSLRELKAGGSTIIWPGSRRRVALREDGVLRVGDGLIVGRNIGYVDAVALDREFRRLGMLQLRQAVART